MSGTVQSISVSTEQLLSMAGELEAKINSAKGSYEQMKSVMAATASYWKGSGGDAYRQRFSSKEEEAEQIFRRFREHVTDLRTMAGVYSEAENAAHEMPAQLPADVLV